jgi:diguanylate cyclase (GGDEF)-like protein
VVRIARDLLAAARSGVDDVYREVERALRRVVDKLDAITVWELCDDRFTCVFASGPRYEHYRGVSVSALGAQSPLGEARRSGRPLLVEGAILPLNPADRVALAVPLDALPLVAYLACRTKPALHEMLDIFALAASAIAIARDRADDRVRATYDALTGLLTARAFRTALAERLRNAPRIRLAPRLALAFIDTDRFKEWNDRYGHAAGDGVLQRVAEVLRSNASGPEDLVGRNGGDEFCIAWFDCEKSEAIRRSESLRTAIAQRFACEEIAITASIGVAAYPTDASTAEGLLEAADGAMYQAKRNGRNRVSFVPQRTFVNGPSSYFAVSQPGP